MHILRPAAVLLSASAVIALAMITLTVAGCAATPPRSAAPPDRAAATRPAAEKPRVVVSVPRGSGIVAEVVDPSRLESDGEIRVRCTLPEQPSWKWSASVSASFAFEVKAGESDIHLDEDVWTTRDQPLLPAPGGSRTSELVLKCPEYDLRRAEDRKLLQCRVTVEVDFSAATVSGLKRRDGSTVRGTTLLGGRYECMEITFGLLGGRDRKPVHVRLRNVSGYDLPATEICARDANTGRVTPWMTLPPTPAGADVMADLASSELTDWVVIEMRWLGEDVAGGADAQDRARGGAK